MKTCSRSALMLLKLMCITLLPGLEAQELNVQPEVTGYLGLDVTLSCKFIQGPTENQIVQVQWELKTPEEEKVKIIVSNPALGITVNGTFLKERVEMAEQSLIIRNVEMRDAGLYTCSITTFPGGSFEGTTKLVVKEQMPLSSGVVSATVIVVLLLLGIMAAIVYLIFIRRPDSSVRQRVHIVPLTKACLSDTSGRVMDMTRPSVIVREDVVYADVVKLKPPRDVTPPSNDKHTSTAQSDDVTYSEVLTLHSQPK